jgi:hypothetical protein
MARLARGLLVLAIVAGAFVASAKGELWAGEGWRVLESATAQGCTRTSDGRASAPLCTSCSIGNQPSGVFGGVGWAGSGVSIASGLW